MKPVYDLKTSSTVRQYAKYGRTS